MSYESERYLRMALNTNASSDDGSSSERSSFLSSTSTLNISQYAPRNDNKWRAKFFLAVLAIFSAIGGFLFGYDTGVVSGAMIKIDNKFNLTAFWHELIVSVTIGAAAISAALSGLLTEVLGRKPVLIIASIVFTIGAAITAASPDKYVLLSGRVIVGVGIGFAAMVVPMYIAESAPPNMRGKLVVMNNLFITGGQFVATLVDGAFSEVSHGWRYMLGAAGIPSIIMLIGFLFLPESPRWLVFHGKLEKAVKVLYKLRNVSKVKQEIKEIVKDHEDYTNTRLGCSAFIKRFFTKSVLLALMVGCGLQMFQQLGGINTVMYYSASIIEMAGFSENNAIWLATIPAFGNFIFTIVGLFLVDRIGRRKLLIGSLVGVVAGFLLLSGSFILSNKESLPAKPLVSTSCQHWSCGTCVGNSHCGFCVIEIHSNGTSNINGTCSPGNATSSNYVLNLTNRTDQCEVYSDITDPDSNIENKEKRVWYYNSCPNNEYAWLAIISLVIYIAFFAPGMGPLPWTINSEIYPNWARSTCIAIATATNWIFNLGVSLTFLTLADGLGQPVTFAFYAGLGFLGLLFAIFLVPETKGRKLEEVEELFQKPYFMSLCSSGENDYIRLANDPLND